MIRRIQKPVSLATLGIILATGALLVTVSGHLLENNFRIDLLTFVTSMWANVASELASIAITILVINVLNDRRVINQEKREHILGMGSPNNSISVESVRIIRARGWGFGDDATLEAAKLANANLQSADLMGMNLSHSNMTHANLRESNLSSSRCETRRQANCPLGFAINLNN